MFNVGNSWLWNTATRFFLINVYSTRTEFSSHLPNCRLARAGAFRSTRRLLNTCQASAFQRQSCPPWQARCHSLRKLWGSSTALHMTAGWNVLASSVSIPIQVSNCFFLVVKLLWGGLIGSSTHTHKMGTVWGCELKWGRKPRQKDTLPGFKVKSLSFSKLSDVVDYCEKTLSMELMQDILFPSSQAIAQSIFNAG